MHFVHCDALCIRSAIYPGTVASVLNVKFVWKVSAFPFTAAAVIQSDGNTNPNQYPDRTPHRYWSFGINSVAHTQVIEYFVIDHHSDKMQCLHLNGFHLRLR
ncbi:hypothetical protein CEXT_470141 [Caerostris extrusa]|uniref:Uncharacterized protein n=1 Tax=Caerostris extrusa TaxID=172846 RepID=A0AAV4MSK7_CAEEX|nr:hypothetical protein CEXT_470141 [Caerostris extrusa]